MSEPILRPLSQPAALSAELILVQALDLEGDERSWVPQRTGVRFRPLILNVSQGYYVDLFSGKIPHPY